MTKMCAKGVRRNFMDLRDILLALESVRVAQKSFVMSVHLSLNGLKVYHSLDLFNRIHPRMRGNLRSNLFMQVAEKCLMVLHLPIQALKY